MNQIHLIKLLQSQPGVELEEGVFEDFAQVVDLATYCEMTL